MSGDQRFNWEQFVCEVNLEISHAFKLATEHNPAEVFLHYFYCEILFLIFLNINDWPGTERREQAAVKY